MKTEAHQFLNGREQAIFIVKPDGLNRVIAGYPLPRLVEGLLRACDLDIREQAVKRLREHQIRQMYPILNRPSEYGEEWKLNVIRALQVAPLRAYLVEGEDAESKAKCVRTFLRTKLTDMTTERGRVVENIAHVSDHDDFNITYDILFRS